MEIYVKDGTLDKYTIILNGDVYIMSKDPLSPQGVFMYAGRESEIRDKRALGKRLRYDRCPVSIKKAIEFLIIRRNS